MDAPEPQKLAAGIVHAHRPQLRPVYLPQLEKKFLISLGLIVRVGPRKEFIGVVPEMHRQLAEDPITQINSVIKILCRGENHLRLLEIAGIEIHRPLYGVLEHANSASIMLVCLLISGN